MSQHTVAPNQNGELGRSPLDETERRGVRPMDLARQLGVAPNVIYTAINTGQLSPIWRLGKKGKAVVIPVDVVERWLAAHAA